MNTEIIMLTDRSGSMEELAADVIGNFNHFIKKQSATGNRETTSVTHILFGSEVTTLYTALPLFAVPLLDRASYLIEGMTALFDAIGLTLRVHKERIDRENWADAVIVAIITDGEENASRLYSQQKVRDLVHDCQRAGWKFLFLGANQDAVLSAAQIGLGPQDAHNFSADPQGIALAYEKIQAAVLQLEAPK